MPDAGEGNNAIRLVPRQITQLITKKCRSPCEILEVWRQHGLQFDEVSCSVALHRLAKLHASGQSWIGNGDRKQLVMLLHSVQTRLAEAPGNWLPQNLANLR